MSYTFNIFTFGSRSRVDASSVQRDTGGTSTRPPPDILTYCCGSRMVYFYPGEDYDRAIDIAIESFPELRDVERDRICLEVRAMHSHQRTVKIGRTAWPFLVATLARFDIVDVCVAPPPPPPVVESTPYVSETSLPEHSGSRTNFIAYGAQMPSSLSRPQFLGTRVVVTVNLFPSKSSRGHHSPQPSQYYRF